MKRQEEEVHVSEDEVAQTSVQSGNEEQDAEKQKMNNQ